MLLGESLLDEEWIIGAVSELGRDRALVDHEFRAALDELAERRTRGLVLRALADLFDEQVVGGTDDSCLIGGDLAQIRRSDTENGADCRGKSGLDRVLKARGGAGIAERGAPAAATRAQEDRPPARVGPGSAAAERNPC